MVSEQSESNQWYVYIVECQDGKLYTGLTDNVERRLKEHKRKGSHFTSYNPAVKLLCKEAFSDKHAAAKAALEEWAPLLIHLDLNTCNDFFN